MLGGIWGCILSELKESPLTIPKKNSGRDFDFPPRPSLKRPKEGLRPFLWKPSRGYGGFRKTGADASLCAYGRRKMDALVPAVIPGPCLVEDEGNDSLVDLNQHWVFVAFGPCRGGALSQPGFQG